MSITAAGTTMGSIRELAFIPPRVTTTQGITAQSTAWNDGSSLCNDRTGVQRKQVNPMVRLILVYTRRGSELWKVIF